MLQIVVVTMVTSTCYSFGGNIYRQVSGLGIGLRASAALARITMCDWDIIWANRQHLLGLKLRLFYRYIDDIRFFLAPITKGWRWAKSKWEYVPDLSSDQTHDQIYTANEVGKSLDDIWDFLTFTTETEQDFPNLHLATLDFQIFFSEDGLIH